MAAKTLAEAFFNTVKNFGDNTSLMTKIEGNYQGIDYNELGRRVKYFALGLANMDIKKGDKVSILSENRAEWAISDLAILSLGAINVPIYPTLAPRQIEYILNDAEAKIIIVSTEEQVKKVLDIFDNLPNLKAIIYMDQVAEATEAMYFYAHLYEKGKEFDKNNPDYFDNVSSAIETDDPCAIVYTSGTTGNPKGAVLSHGNILSNTLGGIETLNIRSTDLFLSFLPLCHVFERMGGQFCPLLAGGSIAYAESIETVAQNLTEAKPTIMCSVPRLFEKIYAKILANAEAGSPLKKKIFFWAINVGEKYVEAEKRGKVGGGLKFKHNLAHKLVFSKIQEKVGGRLRYFISGGAPLSKEIGEFFHAVGVKILEGYGLTESSPVIAVNLENKFKFGTVGPALTKGGVELKIADDGEILTRGPHVMKEYYKNPEETKEVIDDDGWLHTGDIGFLDEDGFLTITDRKKNIIVTSGGKNVAPAAIENKLLTSQLVDQVLIIGDKQKYLTALIVPNQDMLESFAATQKISFKDYAELMDNDQINQYVANEINNVLSDQARFEQIKIFKLVAEPFTIEAGELTPTLKIKRKVVEEKYADLIEQMYQ